MTTFGKLGPDGKLTDVRVIRQADIVACPHVIMVAEHYREDGTCRCDDPSHVEMKGWDYNWNGKEWV